MMNRLLPGLALGGLLFSAPVFAGGPIGTGNFRRAEAIKAVGARNTYSTQVRGLSSVADHLRAPIQTPAGARVLIVEHKAHGTRKVQFALAPLDKGQKVSLMSTQQVNALGIITQEQARTQAKSNGGLLGTKGKPTLKRMGWSSSGNSFQFSQSAPIDYQVKYGNDAKVYRATQIVRWVPMTGGRGETASAWLE